MCNAKLYFKHHCVPLTMNEKSAHSTACVLNAITHSSRRATLEAQEYKELKVHRYCIQFISNMKYSLPVNSYYSCTFPLNVLILYLREKMELRAQKER